MFGLLVTVIKLDCEVCGMIVMWWFLRLQYRCFCLICCSRWVA